MLLQPQLELKRAISVPVYLRLKKAFSALFGTSIIVALDNTSPSPGGWMTGAMCYIVIDRFPGRLVSAYIPGLYSLRGAIP